MNSDQEFFDEFRRSEFEWVLDHPMFSHVSSNGKLTFAYKKDPTTKSGTMRMVVLDNSIVGDLCSKRGISIMKEP